MDARIRKNRNTLYVTGIGILIFEIWSIIKNILVLILVSDNWYDKMLKESDAVSYRKLYISILIITLAIIVLSELAIRLKVGLSAMAVGKGKHSNFSFIFWDIVIILFQFVQLIILFCYTGNTPITVDMVISIFVEITSCYTACDLLVSAMKIRKYNTTLTTSEGHVCK